MSKFIPRTFRASRSEEVKVWYKTQHIYLRTSLPSISSRQLRGLFTKQKKRDAKLAMPFMTRTTMIGVTSLLIGGSVLYILYENDYLQPLPPTKLRSELRAERQKLRTVKAREQETVAQNTKHLSALPFRKGQESREESDDESAWTSFTNKFDALTSFTDSFTDINWASLPGSISDYVVPEWAKLMPDYVSKLQRELSMAPGSLADEIWQDAHDPYLNPEIEKLAAVRVSDEICDEEKHFLVRRRKVTRTALAKYLGLPEEEIHPEDVPCIAMVGSGGGLRALVAGTGSFLATTEAGLFDCVTYTAGVSGSCWLQALYHSSLGGRRLDKLVNHLKARIGTHIASPIVALGALNSAPTNKFLLRGFVEKLKGDPSAEFGIVDVYGVLLAARLLVPKGELGINDDDLKISNQRKNLGHGENPLPIYCSVRHEIPILEESSPAERITQTPSEGTKDKAKVSYSSHCLKPLKHVANMYGRKKVGSSGLR
jgi:cytosolic phospholipase A2